LPDQAKKPSGFRLGPEVHSARTYYFSKKTLVHMETGVPVALQE
jgi:hypothetical protein